MSQREKVNILATKAERIVSWKPCDESRQEALHVVFYLYIQGDICSLKTYIDKQTNI